MDLKDLIKALIIITAMILGSLQVSATESKETKVNLSTDALNQSAVGNYTEAIKLINMAVEKDPKNPFTWLARGMIFQKIPDPIGANESYDRAIDLKPLYYEAWLYKAYILATELNNTAEALKAYDKAIEANPKSSLAFYNKGYLLKDKKHDNESALLAFENASFYDPYFPDTWLNLGQIYLYKGDFMDARIDLEKADKLNKGDLGIQYQIWKLLGQTYLQLKNFQEAKRVLSNASELQPKWEPHDPNIFIMLGKAYLNLAYLNSSDSEDAENAIINARIANRIDGSNSAAHILLGESILKTNRPVKMANDEFIKAIQITPKNYLAWEGIGQACYNSHQFPEALVSFAIAKNIQFDSVNGQAQWVLILLAVAISFLFILTFKKIIPIDLTWLIGNLLGLLLLGWMVSSLLKENEFFLFWSFWIILIIITGGLWVFLGKTATPWSIRVVWAILGYGKKLEALKGYQNTNLLLIILFSFYLMLLFTFLYVMNIYNPNPFGSIDNFGSIANILTLIEFLLISIIIISSAITIPPVMELLKSRTIDQDTRDIVAVTFFSYLCIIVFYSSIAFWFLKIGRNWITLSGPSFLSETPFSLSLSSVYLAVILFISCLFYPYLTGSQGGKNWCQLLQGKKDDYISEMLDILQYKQSDSLIPALESLLNEIDKEKTEFETSTDTDICSEFANKEPAYCADITRIDPGKNYLNFLNKIRIKLVYCITELNNEKNSSNIPSIAAKYAEKCQSEKKEIKDYAVQLEQTRPQLLVYLTALLGPIMVMLYDTLINQIAASTPAMSNLFFNFTSSGGAMNLGMQ